MTRPDWYVKVGPEVPITQGDLIESFPIVTWKRQSVQLEEDTSVSTTLLSASEIVEANVVIVTQACDRVVDFHEVYSTPRDFMESFLEQRASTRLRLVAPYREYLSQAFARFFMRVGLPVQVDLPG